MAAVPGPNRGHKDMVPSKQKPLVGKRILVPPARPEANPLFNMLERYGADVLEFPALRVSEPSDYGPMDRAIRSLKDFDFVIFSGSNCVINFFQRLKGLPTGKAAIGELKVVTVGYGAVSALKKEGVEIDYIPKVHTADGVTESLGGISGSAFLLVRVEGASRGLPERLKRMGAKVTEVVGYRMLVDVIAEMAENAFGRGLDALALANPTSVRFFIKGADELGLDPADVLKGVTVAAVGPATADEAMRHGLTPDIVSKGHIADLAESLIVFFGSGNS